MATDTTTSPPSQQVPIPHSNPMEMALGDPRLKHAVSTIVNDSVREAFAGKRLISEAEYQDLKTARLKNYAIVAGGTMALTLGGVVLYNKVRRKSMGG